VTAGYSGTPLPQKLGIRPGIRVLLVRFPSGLDLGPLGEVTVRRRTGGAPFDVILLFCGSRRELTERFEPLVEHLDVAGALWVCWPKKASGVATDLSEDAVRDHGLRTGLVDVKVAAIDATWSGLKFVRRKANRIRT
jgi:hypothetical protein